MITLITTDWRELNDDLVERRMDYLDTLTRTFAEAGRKMADLLRDEWLSGRHSDDMGLNVITGNLHDSIRSRTERREDTVTSVVWNQDADYWWWNAGHASYVKNRFPVDFIFAQEGEEIYTSAFEAALERIAA